MTQERILWVTPKWPYPPDDGAKMATRALLRSVPNKDRIDLLTLSSIDEVCDREGLSKAYGLVGSITNLSRQGVGSGMVRHLRNVAQMIRHPKTPVTICRYGTPSLKRSFQAILSEGRHAIVVFDGLHPAALTSDGCRFIKPKGVKILYRAHNVEWQIWRKAAEQAPIHLQSLLRRQSDLMKRFETSVIQAADLVVPVSAEDECTFQSMVPGCVTELIPIGLEFPETVPDFPQGEEIHLAFLGRLDWPPNHDGLKWFLDHVWPHVTKPNLRLSIAGVGNGDWLNHHLPMRGVEFLGRIESPDALYAQCHAAIVPIFYGSGTRLKMIEPARFGRPCISTEAGALGSTLDTSHYFHAETASDWLDQIESLTVDACRDCGKAGRDRLKSTFDETSIAHRFGKSLDQLR